MRFQSKKVGGFQVFAVSGVNTISFGIDASKPAQKGLLGFAVERHDPTENERYFMPGFKVFKSVIANPEEGTFVSTFEHPIQSFVWDDFTAKPGRKYEYTFHPLKGAPRNLDRSASPVSIKVETEPLFSKLEHDVFFNRGVASSQAYVRKFGNKKPDSLPPAKRQEALDWLSRDLDEALLKFIAQTAPKDQLLCCFYEFRYRPVADALKEAIDRGVDVQIIIDAKVNETIRDGKVVPSFPREDNLKMIEEVGIAEGRVRHREAKPSAISHNKFMVRVQQDNATEVWTGSTNISEGGIFGQTNVGHWVRNKDVAEKFREYWKILARDLGSRKGDTRSEALEKNNKLKEAVEAILEAPTELDEILPNSVTPIFSPRGGSDVLKMYADFVDSSKRQSCITLAFGVNKVFKERLIDNTPNSPIVFMLLEKQDQLNPRSTQPFVALRASQNVYQAFGAFLSDPVYQWAKETNARILQLNQHVSYIHSKFLLSDPLGKDPLVVTGSANFSDASTNNNDENMIIIRGNRRVADIYYTEFNRLFNHYYFRAVVESLHNEDAPQSEANLFLAEDSSWTKKYAPNTLKSKRLKLYVTMHID